MFCCCHTAEKKPINDRVLKKYQKFIYALQLMQMQHIVLLSYHYGKICCNKSCLRTLQFVFITTVETAFPRSEAVPLTSR